MAYHKANLVVAPIEFEVVEQEPPYCTDLIDMCDILGAPSKLRKKQLAPEKYPAFYSHKGGLEVAIVPRRIDVEWELEETSPIYTEIPAIMAGYQPLLLIRRHIKLKYERKFYDIQFLEDNNGQIIRRINSSKDGTLATEALTAKNAINLPVPEVPSDEVALDDRLKPITEINIENMPQLFKEAHHHIKNDTFLKNVFSGDAEKLIDDLTLTPLKYYELLIGLAEDKRNAGIMSGFRHLTGSDNI